MNATPLGWTPADRFRCQCRWKLCHPSLGRGRNACGNFNKFSCASLLNLILRSVGPDFFYFFVWDWWLWRLSDDITQSVPHTHALRCALCTSCGRGDAKKHLITSWAPAAAVRGNIHLWRTHKDFKNSFQPREKGVSPDDCHLIKSFIFLFDQDFTSTLSIFQRCCGCFEFIPERLCASTEDRNGEAWRPKCARKNDLAALLCGVDTPPTR